MLANSKHIPKYIPIAGVIATIVCGWLATAQSQDPVVMPGHGLVMQDGPQLGGPQFVDGQPGETPIQAAPIPPAGVGAQVIDGSFGTVPSYTLPATDQELCPPSRSDRINFVGSRACLDCHRTEYLGWLRTKHFENVPGRFDTSKEDTIAAKYFSKHGNLDACKTCHVSPDAFGREKIETGVSCETCHGAAGGPLGWLNFHGSYGHNQVSRQHESFEHKIMRQARCDDAGMLRSSKQYDNARKCNSCHIVSNKDVLTAGHKTFPDDFEYMSWINGEIRHNFHVQPMHNAKTASLAIESGQTAGGRKRVALVVGRLAEIEACLLNLAAHAPDKSAVAQRIKAEEAAAENEDEDADDKDEEEIDEGEFPSAIDFWAERVKEAAEQIREDVINQDYLDEQAELAREAAEEAANKDDEEDADAEDEEDSEDDEEEPEEVFTDPDLLAIIDLVASVMGSPDPVEVDSEDEEDAEEEDAAEDDEEEEEFDVWLDGEIMRELGDYYHPIASRHQLRDTAARVAHHARSFVLRHDGRLIKTITDDDLDVEGKGKKVFEPARILTEN